MAIWPSSDTRKKQERTQSRVVLRISLAEFVSEILIAGSRIRRRK
jgi:hypothetical protein